MTPAAPVFGQAVTLTATVSPSPSPGLVSFLDGGVLVGTGAVNGSGIAQTTTLALSDGPHSLVAVYGRKRGRRLFGQTIGRADLHRDGGTGRRLHARTELRRGIQSVFRSCGDFNGDGSADLAVANFRASNVNVLVGNRNGAFQAAVNFAAGTNPVSVALGDFKRGRQSGLGGGELS